MCPASTMGRKRIHEGSRCRQRGRRWGRRPAGTCFLCYGRSAPERLQTAVQGRAQGTAVGFEIMRPRRRQQKSERKTETTGKQPVITNEPTGAADAADDLGRLARTNAGA